MKATLLRQSHSHQGIARGEMFLGNLSSSMCGATCDSDVTLAAIMGIISYLQMRAVSGGLGLPFIG